MFYGWEILGGGKSETMSLIFFFIRVPNNKHEMIVGLLKTKNQKHSIHVFHLKGLNSNTEIWGIKQKRMKSEEVGAGSFSTGAETWDVMETESFAPGLRRWICFI